MSTKQYHYIRQFISSYIQGKNTDAILQSLAEEAQKLEDLSISVTDQLYISTASEQYLDRRLSEVGIIRPSELGMSDEAFRKMGIQITAQKQITEAIHTVLSTFFGDETTRAWIQSSKPEPYILEDGMDLDLEFENGQSVKIQFNSENFSNISQATARELSDVITRTIRSYGINGYAQPYTNNDTGKTYVQIYGSAKGPYSLVRILGGEVQSKLEFPLMRPTEQYYDLSHFTTWEITKVGGSVLRFRWSAGNVSPLLGNIFIDDKVMIYGSGFKAAGLQGTFKINNMRPPSNMPDVNSGWFEIENTSIAESNFQVYVNQYNYNDLKFFLAQKVSPYSLVRYALAFEPKDDKLKIYLPATTKVIRRDLIGSAHLHMMLPKDDFLGTYGSVSEDSKKIIIKNEYTIRIKDDNLDNDGFGGYVIYDSNVIPIEYTHRSNGFINIITNIKHGIVPDINGKSDKIINVSEVETLYDDSVNKFNGAYVVDPTSAYTLTDKIVNTMERILQGETKQFLTVNGFIPNEPGFFTIDLAKDTEENGIPYLGTQIQNEPTTTNISLISQIGNTITVSTNKPNSAIINGDVLIMGTSHFNGTYTVTDIISPNTFKCTNSIVQSFAEYNTGSCTVLINGIITRLILDPTYIFKFKHLLGSDISIISDKTAYTPSPDGSDYGFYITGTTEGRIFAEDLIKKISALGINIEIVIVYPDDTGLGNMGEENSDKLYVWG